MKIFSSFFRQAMRNTFIYKFEFWVRRIVLVFIMYGVYCLWNILYTQNNDSGVDLSGMISYGILGVALQASFITALGPQRYISSQVRIGALDTDLIKPIDFHVHMLARNSGETLSRLITSTIPCLIIGFIFFNFQLPGDFIQGSAFILSIVLGYAIQFSLNFIIGILAVISIDIKNISWAYISLISFFSGDFIPLWLFPAGLRNIAEILPFKGIFYIPISIYIGNFSGTGIVSAVLFQIIWVLILAVLGRLFWSFAYSRIKIQGG